MSGIWVTSNIPFLNLLTNEYSGMEHKGLVHVAHLFFLESESS